MDLVEHELLNISNNEVENNDNISSLEASNQWTSWRNDLFGAI